MRVVSLGAGGAMGAEAARHLAALDGITELVLTDRTEALAAATAASLATTASGDPTAAITTAGVDLLDRDALRRLLEPADLVVNAAGPFFRLGVPTLDAAIDTGTTYVDICDDPDPTTAMMARDDAARSAGVGALVGMGASPGLSNLLAKRAAARLDVVDDCFCAWPLDVPTPGREGTVKDDGRTADGRPSAAAVHLMAQVSGTIEVVLDGAPVRRAPLEAVTLRYPGAGVGTGYTVGHPEPVTLRSSLGVTGQAADLVLLQRTSVAFLRQIQAEIADARLDLEGAAARVVAPGPLRSLQALVRSRRLLGHGDLPPFFALLRGRRDGQRVHVGCHLTTSPLGMAAITAIPTVLAVAQLLDRPLPPGVHPPEQVIDPTTLLTGLVPHCDPPASTVDELAPVVETTA